METKDKGQLAFEYVAKVEERLNCKPFTDNNMEQSFIAGYDARQAEVDKLKTGINVLMDFCELRPYNSDFRFIAKELRLIINNHEN